MTTSQTSGRSDSAKRTWLCYWRSTVASDRSCYLALIATGLCLASVVSLAQPIDKQQQVNNSSSTTTTTTTSITSANSSHRPKPHETHQSISNWIQLTSSSSSSSRQQQQDAFTPNARLGPTAGNGVAVEVSPPPSNLLFQYQPVAFRRPQQHQVAAAASTHTLVATANRSARTVAGRPELSADQPQQDDQDQFNLFVSNTCERDFMLIRVKTSRPFYGVIHTLNYRRKPLCAFEGDGATDYQLNISHALDSRDPSHCGVIKLRKPTERDQGELLSVVVAIRMHKNVELTDDKLVVLNCTNRCRLLDCSSASAGLLSQRQSTGGQFQDYPVKQRQLEKEFDEVATSQDQTSWWTRSMKRFGDAQKEAHSNRMAAGNSGNNNGCNLWRLPWVVALICCLLILLLGAAISNCIICMSMSSAESRQGARPSSSDDVDCSSELETSNRDRKERLVTQQKYIDYDNSEHHRPVDVAYLQAASGRTQRANRHSNGSHHRHHQSRSPASKTVDQTKR